MDWTGVIGVVMGVISTIVCGFGYNQYAKNKDINKAWEASMELYCNNLIKL